MTEDPIPCGPLMLPFPAHQTQASQLPLASFIRILTTPADHRPVPSATGQQCSTATSSLLQPHSAPTQPMDHKKMGQGWLGGEGEQKCPVIYFSTVAGFAVGPVKPSWHPLQESTSPNEAGQRCSKVCPDCARGWKPHSSSFRDWLWKSPSFC